MPGSGVTLLDFGAFPGVSDASIAVTGQGGIVAGSLVEAWLRPVDTADHSADEHMLESIKVFAHSIVAGTGFTISGFNTSEIHEAEAQVGSNRTSGLAVPGNAAPQITYLGGLGTKIWGLFTVAWAWN